MQREVPIAQERQLAHLAAVEAARDVQGNPAVVPFQLHSILSARRMPIDAESPMARLECSRATLYRIVNTMKDHLGAPIEYDAERGGFLYARTGEEHAYQLPGL